jgi:protein-S-isoprenylcysteine O-methyltransferase Ste14
MTVVKSFLYLMIEAGLFALYVPLTFFRTGPRMATGILAFLAIPLWLLGSLIVLWCFREFTFRGRGTPLPADPPRQLVLGGPYRHVRNPIYVAVGIIYAGYFLWFGYWAILLYTGLALLGAHAFVVLYEEPALKRRFGASYEEYLRTVPRWVPKFR